LRCRDYEDAVNLGIECGVSTEDELREVFRQFFSDENLPPRAALRLEELASDIRAKLD
jgi:plasmid stability protein